VILVLIQLRQDVPSKVNHFVDVCVKGIGGATVEALWERGWLPNPAGLYKLTQVGPACTRRYTLIEVGWWLRVWISCISRFCGVDSAAARYAAEGEALCGCVCEGHWGCNS
jgi:hypothetical protein